MEGEREGRERIRFREREEEVLPEDDDRREKSLTPIPSDPNRPNLSQLVVNTSVRPYENGGRKNI